MGAKQEQLSNTVSIQQKAMQSLEASTIRLVINISLGCRY
jgi:hypothetical protein